MDFDYQLVFNIALGVAGTIAGWFFKIFYDQIRILEEEVDSLEEKHEEDHRAVIEKITALALSLPEKYVHRGDFENLVKVMNHRFDKLEEKIESLRNK